MNIPPSPISIERAGSFGAELERLYCAITAKAHEHLTERGFIAGYDVDDWLRAERDLVLKPEYTLSRQSQAFIVEITLPESEMPGLVIRFTPREMLISSDTNREGRRLFRIVRFPQIVDSVEICTDVCVNKLLVTARIAEQSGVRRKAQSALAE